jgi:hypothetical protein
MRPISRVALARQLAAAIESAQCDGMGHWWSEREAEHAAAVTGAEARGAAAEALELCGRCPERSRCAELAQVDQYTGLAAGAWYLNGTAKDVGAVAGGTPLAAAAPAPLDKAG